MKNKTALEIKRAILEISAEININGITYEIMELKTFFSKKSMKFHDVQAISVVHTAVKINDKSKIEIRHDEAIRMENSSRCYDRGAFAIDI